MTVQDPLPPAGSRGCPLAMRAPSHPPGTTSTPKSVAWSLLRLWAPAGSAPSPLPLGATRPPNAACPSWCREQQWWTPLAPAGAQCRSQSVCMGLRFAPPPPPSPGLCPSPQAGRHGGALPLLCACVTLPCAPRPGE